MFFTCRIFSYLDSPRSFGGGLPFQQKFQEKQDNDPIFPEKNGVLEPGKLPRKGKDEKNGENQTAKCKPPLQGIPGQQGHHSEGQSHKDDQHIGKPVVDVSDKLAPASVAGKPGTAQYTQKDGPIE